MYDYKTLGDLLGAKGYIRGPFGSALVRKELHETGVYAVYEQAQAISGSRSFRYFINQEKFEELRRFRVQPGDLLISCSGTVGRVSIVMDDDPDGIISQALLILRPQTGEIIPEYLRWFLSTREGQNALTNASHGSVQLNIAPRATVESIEIPTPDLRTQEAISHILGTLDDKIELNQKMNQTLEEIAKAIFKSWFVDFDPVRAKAEGRPTGLAPEISDLFPDELVDSEIGEIPKGWSVGALSDVADITMGQSPLGDTYNDNGVGLPFYQGSTDFGFRFPSLRKYCSEPKRLANADDVLISVRAPVGDLNRAKDDCCIGRGLASLRAKNSLQTWVFYRCKFLSQQLETFNSEGTVFGSINGKDLKGLPTVLPPEVLCKAFEEIGKPMDDAVRNRTLEIEVLTELRDTLLPKLISGDLRIPDAEKFLEEAGI